MLDGLGPAWSLCVEAAFYLVLPLLALAAFRVVRWRARSPRSRARVHLGLIGALAGISLALRIVVSGSVLRPVSSTHVVIATSLPAMFDWFALGLALSVVASEWSAGGERFARLRQLAARPSICWMLAATMFIAALPTRIGSPMLSMDGVIGHVLIGCASALLVLPVVGHRRSGGRRRSAILNALSNRRTVWLGSVSYGIFLFNVPVSKGLSAVLFHTPLSSTVTPGLTLPTVVALLAATLAITVAIAAVSWYLVELPMQRRFAARDTASRLDEDRNSPSRGVRREALGVPSPVLTGSPAD